MPIPIQPHGGYTEPLENLVSEEKAKELLAETASAPKIVVSDADLSTVRRLGDGALTPLTGFMTREEYNRVLDEMHILVDGKPYAWGIPLALPVTDAEKSSLKNGAKALLVDERNEPVGVIEIAVLFEWDKKNYNTKVYGTERMDHPGARIALEDGRNWLAGGKVHVFPWKTDRTTLVGKYFHTPRETRKILADKGWDAAIAFQTRNPLHRAHEYAMVYAVEKLTKEGRKVGVVLNPLVGETKSDDVPAEIRMQTYENLKEMKLLGVGDSDAAVWEKAGYSIHDVFDLFALDIKMFYGGPREAVMHAVYRQNYGFSHIVIGRKHADAPYDDGTNIWGDFDAQEIFTKLTGDLKIKPVNVGFAAYYEELSQVGLIEEHAHKGWKPVTIAGRKLRAMFQEGEIPDPRVIRPETSELLIQAYRARAAGQAPKSTNITWHKHSVDRSDREQLNDHKGATLWFTGLSGSGKSTLANEVAALLHEHGARTYVLDGDNIRHGLNKDLGFSPDDRKENIRRIGEVAKLFTDAGVINMTAFISPYREDRQTARDLQPGDFLEVHVTAPLDVCEERDPKGLYKKARAGEIPNFTGISAPYEEPENAALTIDTSKHSLEESAVIVVAELQRRGILNVEIVGMAGGKKESAKV